jgi:hypothetical protein
MIFPIRSLTIIGVLIGATAAIRGRRRLRRSPLGGLAGAWAGFSQAPWSV